MQKRLEGALSTRAREMKDEAGNNFRHTQSSVIQPRWTPAILHFSQPVKSTIQKRTGVPNVNYDL